MNAIGFTLVCPPGMGSYYASRVHLFSPHSDVALVKLSAFQPSLGISKQTEPLQEKQRRLKNIIFVALYPATWIPLQQQKSIIVFRIHPLRYWMYLRYCANGLVIRYS